MMDASSTVTQSGHLMRGTTEPLIMKNNRSPLGRSLTIILIFSPNNTCSNHPTFSKSLRELNQL